MSAITLTLPMLNDGTLTRFEWTRGFDGEGMWITRTRMGNMPPNCRVHTQMQHELTVKAREQGLSEPHNFAKFPPKPVKEKTVRTRAPRKPKAPNLMGGFNPFAMV